MGDGNQGDNPVVAKTKDSKNKKWEPKNKVLFQCVEILKVNTQ